MVAPLPCSRAMSGHLKPPVASGRGEFIWCVCVCIYVCSGIYVVLYLVVRSGGRVGGVCFDRNPRPAGCGDPFFLQPPPPSYPPCRGRFYGHYRRQDSKGRCFSGCTSDARPWTKAMERSLDWLSRRLHMAHERDEGRHETPWRPSMMCWDCCACRRRAPRKRWQQDPRRRRRRAGVRAPNLRAERDRGLMGSIRAKESLCQVQAGRCAKHRLLLLLRGSQQWRVWSGVVR